MSIRSRLEKFPPRLGFRERVGFLVAVILLITGISLAGVGYRLTARAALDDADTQAATITDMMQREIFQAVQPILPYLSVLARSPLPGYTSAAERLKNVPAFQAILENNPMLEGLWIGYANGDFFLVERLASDSERQSVGAPPASATLVWSIERGQGSIQNENLFFNAAGQLLGHRHVPGQLYDPRLRPWYQQAMQADGRTGTANPDTSLPQVTGLVFSEKSPDGRAVVGGSLSLERLSATLRRQLPSPGSELAILGPNGALVIDARTQPPTLTQMALNQPSAQPPIITRAVTAYKEGRRGHITEIDPEGRVWLLSLDEFDLVGEARGVLLLALPRDEILTTATTFIHRSLMVVAGLMFIGLPLTWLILRRLSRPLGALAMEMRHFPAHYLNPSEQLNSNVTEVRELALSLAAIQKEVQKLLHLLVIINTEPNFNRVLETVIKETTSLAYADGGLVALLDRSQDCFSEGQAYWWGNLVDITPSLRLDCRQPDFDQPVHQALHRNKTILTSIQREDRRGLVGYLDPGFADPATTRVDLVCVPLHSRQGEKLGTLALFRAIKPGAETFRSQEIIFIQSLASAAAIALENHHLSRGHWPESPV